MQRAIMRLGSISQLLIRARSKICQATAIWAKRPRASTDIRRSARRTAGLSSSRRRRLGGEDPGLHNQAIILFYALLVLSVSAAFLKGGAPERTGPQSIVRHAGDGIGGRAFVPPRFHSIDPVAAIIDAIATVSFGALSSMHAELGHMGNSASTSQLNLAFCGGHRAVHPGIYITMKSGPTLLVLVVLLLGTRVSSAAASAIWQRSCLDGLVKSRRPFAPLDRRFIDRLADRLGTLEREALFVAYLDRAGAFLGDELITGGTSCSLGIPYRLLFERAFKRGAARLVLAHNHPSGSAEPSELDIRSTRGLQALAVPMGWNWSITLSSARAKFSACARPGWSFRKQGHRRSWQFSSTAHDFTAIRRPNGASGSAMT